MPLLSLDQLVSVETRETVMDAFLAIATALQLRTTAWQSGQPIRSFLAVVATKFSDYTSVRATIARAGFLTLTEGDWLTFVCHHFYGVDRIPAVEATGYVTLTNTEPAPYVLNPGDLILAHATSGKTYRNRDPLTIPASSSIADVPIFAEEAGSASDAAPGAITVLVTSLIGVTSTNPLAVLGSDEEDDPALILRAQQQQAATSPMGPKEVYSYVAKTPAYSATSVPITRTYEELDTTTGEQTCYLATAAGAPSGGDVAIVQEAQDEWAEPQGFENTAAAAANLTVDVTATVNIRSGLTVAAIKAAIELALARYFRTIPIGGSRVPPATGKVYQDAIKARIIGATPGVELVTLTLPAADVAVAASEVPVLGTVTLTINLL